MKYLKGHIETIFGNLEVYVFRNEKATGNQPTHNILVKDSKTGKLRKIGALWQNESQKPVQEEVI